MSRPFRQGDRVKVKRRAGGRWLPGKVTRCIEQNGVLIIEVYTEQYGLKIGKPDVEVRHVIGETYELMKMKETLAGGVRRVRR